MRRGTVDDVDLLVFTSRDIREGSVAVKSELGHISFFYLLHASFFTGPPARAVHAAGAPLCPNVSNYVVKFTGVGVCSPRLAGHSEFCKNLPDSLTVCIGLAANGAGPRRCTAGVPPASSEDPGQEECGANRPRSPVHPQWLTTSERPDVT